MSIHARRPERGPDGATRPRRGRAPAPPRSPRPDIEAALTDAQMAVEACRTGLVEALHRRDGVMRRLHSSYGYNAARITEVIRRVTPTLSADAVEKVLKHG